MLNWRTITPSGSPRFLVKGTEIAAAFSASDHRFQIVETRTRDAHGFSDVEYVVRDAHRITDAQVRAGFRPPIVMRFVGLDEAEIFCAGQREIY